MATSAPAASRPFDVILWGATGFTGRLVAAYLARTAPTLRWALAGRSTPKLEAVRAAIAKDHPSAASVPLLIADAQDKASLAALVSQTRVICSTVGPFALQGQALVEACVTHGTDYCDSTGEPHFVHAMIARHHEAAVRAGVRIVHCCGFDSIPSDLGVLLLADRAKREGRALAEVRFLLGPWRGGPSGGTLATMIGLVELAGRDREVRRVLTDPYSLSPDRAHDLNTDGRDPIGVAHDRTLDVWTAPFVMAGINARIVRRSNALTGHAYGKGFRYQETLCFRGDTKGFALAALSTAGVAAAGIAAALPPTRALLRRLVPASGEGPSYEELARGFFKIRLYARFEDEPRPSLLARVEGKQDPGYLETAKMLGESSLCLAEDPRREGFEGGVLTPSTALGVPLIERLRRAGMVFSIEPLV